MSERALEIRVGLFVLAAVAGLVAFVLVLGDISFGRDYRLFVDYAYTGPIHVGSPVKVSGVEVGQVGDVAFLGGEVQDEAGNPLLVRITLDLEDDARPVAREGAQFVVGTQGFLGEPYVELVPGDRQRPQLEDGAVVRGVDSPRTDLLLGRVFDVLDSLGRTLKESEGDLQGLIRGSAQVVATVGSVVGDRGEDLGRALDDVIAAAADLKGLAAEGRALTEEGGDLKVLLGDARATVGTLRRELPPLLADLSAGAEEVARLSESTRDLGEADVARFKDLIAQYQTVGENLSRLTDDLAEVLAQIERGEGSLGALMQDDQIYDDLKALLRDIREHPWKVIWKE